MRGRRVADAVDRYILGAHGQAEDGEHLLRHLVGVRGRVRGRVSIRVGFRVRVRVRVLGLGLGC